jgi:hypothetical protein
VSGHDRSCLIIVLHRSSSRSFLFRCAASSRPRAPTRRSQARRQARRRTAARRTVRPRPIAPRPPTLTRRTRRHPTQAQTAPRLSRSALSWCARGRALQSRAEAHVERPRQLLLAPGPNRNRPHTCGDACSGPLRVPLDRLGALVSLAALGSLAGRLRSSARRTRSSRARPRRQRAVRGLRERALPANGAHRAALGACFPGPVHDAPSGHLHGRRAAHEAHQAAILAIAQTSERPRQR